ncbi:MAG: T9SS type A sorting domain-containing protein [Clostridium sp.]|nr:T9SS type A sorting domain-containing protein [Clostridium sp.]
MNKTLTALAVASVAGLFCIAPESSAQTSLSVKTSGGHESSYALSLQSRLKFVDGKLRILSGESTVAEHPLANVEKLMFGTGLTAIDILPADQTAVCPEYYTIRDIVTFTGQPASPCPLELYSLGGSRVIAVTDWSGEQIDMSGLAAGIYLLHINNETFKLIKL